MPSHPFLDDPVSGPFWRGASEHELRFQRCRSCGRSQFYPRRRCRFCSSEQLDWQTSEGEGTLYSFTEVHRGPRRDTPVPYVLALVDLAEGFRILVRLEGAPAGEIELGLPVRIVFTARDDGLVVPEARPR